MTMREFVEMVARMTVAEGCDQQDLEDSADALNRLIQEARAIVRDLPDEYDDDDNPMDQPLEDL